MVYPQGAIVVADDPFGDAPKRPYLVLSNDRLPFHGQEYIAAVVTTTARSEAIELGSSRYEKGTLPRQSYVSPWTVVTLKDWLISKQPARVTDSTVDDVRQELNTSLQT